MAIQDAVITGLAGNDLSKKITGTNEVSTGRTVVAVGAGATTGAVASGAIAVGAAALGVAAAPVVVPLTVASAVVAGIASLFD